MPPGQEPEREVEDPRAIAETQETEPERAANEGEGEGQDEWSLSVEEQSQVAQLKTRDAEVRAHEQAHVAAGGGHITSGPSYSYQKGPDGKSYAIGGEVGIDTSTVSGDPAASLQKARAIIRAALAPAEPSSQDFRVAASARAMEIEAQRALQEEQEALIETTARAETGGEANTGRAQSAETASSQSGTEVGGRIGARERLEERIAGFFASPAPAGLSRFA